MHYKSLNKVLDQQQQKVESEKNRKKKKNANEKWQAILFGVWASFIIVYGWRIFVYFVIAFRLSVFFLHRLHLHICLCLCVCFHRPWCFTIERAFLEQASVQFQNENSFFSAQKFNNIVIIVVREMRIE